jgi:hypothetical protein
VSFRCTGNVLLLAWNVLGFSNADEAEVTSVDSCGFTMKMKVRPPFFWGVPVEVVETYEFSRELLSHEAISQELKTLRYSSRFACWPPDTFSIFSVILIMSALICSIDYDSPLASIYYQNIKYYSLLVYKTPQVAQAVLGAIVFGHVCEVIYVFNVFRRLEMTILQMSTWITMIIVLGYSVTSRVMHLDNINQIDGRSSRKLL